MGHDSPREHHDDSGSPSSDTVSVVIKRLLVSKAGYLGAVRWRG